MLSLRRVVVAALLGTGIAHAQPPEVPTPSQQEFTISGRVISALGKPVRGALVRIEGQEDGVRTDAQGRFRIKAVLGATLVVDAQGYNPGLATAASLALDDIVLLTVEQATETIEVEGEAPAEAPGAAQLDREELQRVPGTGGDIVRALTVMPGVVNLQIPLGYSGVVIRGSSPQDSKVLIDDFEVPVLFHNIGFRAITPAETIATLDFIPGGFDVSHGRASSGIVKLDTRMGAENRTTQAEVSFIDGGLLAQGPAGKDTRYMFALRRSTIDFVLPALIPDDVDLSLTTVPRYWDQQLRVDHELNTKWDLTFSTLGTDDIFELFATKNEDADEKRFFNRTRFLRGTVAARWSDGPWSAKLALSQLAQQFVFEIGAYQYIDVRIFQTTPRAEITRTAAKAAGLTDVVWRSGAELAIGRGKLELALPVEPREGEPMPEFDPEDTSVQFDGVIWTPNVAAWSMLSANLDKQIRATAGVRVDYFGRPEELAVQPRGELAYKIAKPWTLRFAAGAYRRPPEYQSEYLEKALQSERSTQLVLGAQYEPREGVRVQASTYYTDRTALITKNLDKMTTSNNGRGYTTGAEILGTYRGGPWFAWLSYSYTVSRRVDRPGEEERVFSFDQPHSMNAAVSWKYGKWTFGGRWQLYSGLPYTPPLGSVFDSDRNIYIPIYGQPNTERAPIHHQLDLRVDRAWKWGPVEMTGFLDVQNVYMNTSLVTYFYSYDYSQKTEFKSIPIIPSLGLRGVF